MTNLFTNLSNGKLKYLCTLVVLLYIGIGSAWGAATTIYSETFGDNGSNNTAWGSVTCFSDDNTASWSSTSTWKVSKNSSDVCNVTGTSGLSNAFCGSEGGTLIINFGDISSYSDIVLSFNYFNNRAGGNARTFTCCVSSDGGSNWSSNILANNTTNGWASSTVTYNVSAAYAANFSVKFTNTSNNTSRIDDVKLIGTAAAFCSANPSIGSASLNGSFF